MNIYKKAKIRKWLTFLFFAIVVVFIALLTKNQGDFSATWSDFVGIFS